MGRQRKDDEVQATKGFRPWGTESPIRDRVMAIVAWVGLALIVCGSLSGLYFDLWELTYTDITWAAIAVLASLSALVVIAALARGRRRPWLFLTVGYAAIGAILTPICLSGWIGSGHGGPWEDTILFPFGIILSLPGTVAWLVTSWLPYVGLDPLTLGGAVSYGLIGMLIGVFLRRDRGTSTDSSAA